MGKWIEVFDKNIFGIKHSIHIKDNKFIVVINKSITMQVCEDEPTAQAKATLLRIEYEKLDPDKIFRGLMEMFGWDGEHD